MPTKKVMNLTIKVGATPRVYVERIDITGNTSTRDKVIRREFRLNEGDAFNALKVKRSQDRIQSLGFFQDKLEIKQTEGSAPDRVVLGVNVEEKPTGPAVAVGWLFEPREVRRPARGQPEQLHGQGPDGRRSVNWSRLFEVGRAGLHRPVFPRQADSLGCEHFRRDYNNFNYIGTSAQHDLFPAHNRRLGFGWASRSPNIGASVAVTPFKPIDISLDPATFYTDPDGTGPLPAVCDPLKAGVYLCDELGNRLTSAIGFSTVYDDTDGIRPTRGQRLTWSEDFAGLGGDVRYFVRASTRPSSSLSAADWMFSLHGEGGYVAPLQKPLDPGQDAVRITDRFFDIGFAASTSAASAPAFCAKLTRMMARSTRRRRSPPTRSAAAHITWAGWSCSSR